MGKGWCLGKPHIIYQINFRLSPESYIGQSKRPLLESIAINLSNTISNNCSCPNNFYQHFTLTLLKALPPDMAETEFHLWELPIQHFYRPEKAFDNLMSLAMVKAFLFEYHLTNYLLSNITVQYIK